MKRAFFFISLIIILAVISFSGYPTTYPPRETVRVTFLDVGQGDAILILTPEGKTMLVDGGPDRLLTKRLGAFLPWWQKELDVVLLTHAHADHLMGLVNLSQHYQLNLVLHNLTDTNAPLTKQWLEYLKIAQVLPQKINQQASFPLGDFCQVNILSASSSSDINDQSLVSELVCGQRKFLLTGDAGIKIEQEIVPADYDVLKVSHHGSLSATSEEFLQKIKPEIAVISVGENNKFSHPHPNTIKRLVEQNVDIYRTDQLGSFSIFANNKEIYLK